MCAEADRPFLVDNDYYWRRIMDSLPVQTKGQVNAAGLVIRDHDSPFTQDIENALDVLGAWRTSHAYPLQTVYMSLRERAKKIDPKAIVSQRLKRVPSIVVKLQRNHNMKLSTVQDIGGCRAVVSDIQAVRKLARKYKTVVRDYITSPKSDGYRSIHLVEQYQPTIKKYQALAGRRIELQFRTHLQHAWATAVETVDSLLGQNLKTGGGEADWKRFFALAASVIAIKEGCAPVPGTPSKESVLKKEIEKVAGKLDVFNRLNGLATSVENLSKSGVNMTGGIYILVLDLNKKIVNSYSFDSTHMEDAATLYLTKEKEHFGNPCMQIVQVSVAQLRDLKRAYPNYYLNAQAFLSAIKEVL
jgi:uncharacterized protein YfkK (UPF0435 family)